jgi:hypothetical protein
MYAVLFRDDLFATDMIPLLFTSLLHNFMMAVRAESECSVSINIGSCQAPAERVYNAGGERITAIRGALITAEMISCL